MADTTIIKVDGNHSPKGKDGQKYLANGKTVSMRLWEREAPGPAKPPVRRDYETVGYAIAGRAELTIEGQTVLLHANASWVVPKGAEHSYRILEEFTAVEATSPPAEVHGRDEGWRNIAPKAADLPADEPVGALEPVARFRDAMPTGATVSHRGRTLVNHPKWGDDVRFTVAELRDGETAA